MSPPFPLLPVVVAIALLVRPDGAEAAQVCHADRGQLRAAVVVVVGSFRCEGFHHAIFGAGQQRFLSASATIDQSTGSCEREIVEATEAAQLAALKDPPAFCAEVESALLTWPALAAAARDLGAR
ncbi:MAG: hypothetical protein R3D33_04355 [Hyphomicrobiaceae bacterium]